MTQKTLKSTPFTNYQVLLTTLFLFILFTIVVDYLTLPTLSAILLSDLQISTKQFGLLVSIYAFSAGISSFVATTFADSFARKKLLLFYYGGFLLGMILCANASSWSMLILARLITGVFGGVVASICFATIADLFQFDQRGRVMGYVQMAFPASQVLGLPIALYLANQINWQFIYWMIFLIGLCIFFFILIKFKPIDQHFPDKRKEPPLNHSLKIIGSRDYWMVFSNNILLVFGDVLFMTFSAAYATNNLGVSLENLPLLFSISGIATLLFGPIWGQLSDRFGILKIFFLGSALTILIIAIYSHLGLTPLWIVIVLNVLLFVGINARMVTSTALTTIVPKSVDRGAFMAVDASFQQLSGGLAATTVGVIVFQTPDGLISRYPLLGLIVITLIIITIGLMYKISQSIAHTIRD